MMEKPDVFLYIDGCCKGNPGPAAVGGVLYGADGAFLTSFGRPIGRATNNIAEYCALLDGFKAARSLNVRTVEVRADSQLLVRQMTGVYRIRDPKLQRYAEQARQEARRFLRVSYTHIPREENREADTLANASLAAEGRTKTARGGSHA